jgi:hypothetical protein
VCVCVSALFFRLLGWPSYEVQKGMGEGMECTVAVQRSETFGNICTADSLVCDEFVMCLQHSGNEGAYIR